MNRYEVLKQIDNTMELFTRLKKDESQLFRIGEVCVEESKLHITSEMAVERIREILGERNNET